MDSRSCVLDPQVVVKTNITDVVPVNEKSVSAVEEEFHIQTENEFPLDIRRFLSYPEGSSHIASLMEIIESTQVCMFSPEGLTHGYCIPPGFSPLVSTFLTRRDFRFELSQLKFSTSEDPLARGRKARHEPTCEKNGMRKSTHRPKSSITLRKLSSHTEQVHQEFEAAQDGRESASVSVTTNVFSCGERDAAGCGHGALDEDPTAVDGPVVPSGSRAVTEGEEQRFSYEGSLDQLKRAQRKSPRWVRSGGSSKRPKLSTYCKKEANKNYRQAHRNAHIVAERLRRKQMNEYFAVLRDIIPSSYIPRLDQATTLAAAVNLVKDLEHLVQRLQEQRNQGTQLSFSPYECSCSNLITESGSFESPECTQRYSSERPTTETPWIDVESGLYGQLHANLSSASGEVAVQITQAEITVTVYTCTSRKRTDQVIILLEAFQDLQLWVTQVSISANESQALYKFHTEISLRLNAKVIASKVHDALLALDLQNEG